jgi:bifunctional enzyme CysN/CysC
MRVAMMGITRAVLAVNKMDLAGFAQETFERIAAEYRAFAQACGVAHVEAIPVCALDGDNLFVASPRMPWYAGPTLMGYLDSVPIDDAAVEGGFRMPVQWVKRPNADFRGFAGRVAAGRVRPGDALRVVPSGVEATVREVWSGPERMAEALAGDSVTLTLDREVDVARGDVLAAAADAPAVTDQFEAKLLWLGEHALMPGRPYLLRIHSREVSATVTAIKHRIDVASGAQLAARSLVLNEIATVNISASHPVAFEPYAASRALGAFILVDKLTFDTVGAGMIDFALRRASNIHWQALELDKSARATAKHQRPRCIWFTGLSGSGKSTLANLLEKRLHAEGRHTYLLDGDNVRHGLNRDLGFTEADRVENIRRVGEVAKLMVEGGLIVLCSFISPYRAERDMVRALVGEGEFIEVFVDTPIADCIERDPKGLYAKAKAGTLKNFTGIDAPYEVPDAPEVHLVTIEKRPETLADEVIAALRSRGIGA